MQDMLVIDGLQYSNWSEALFRQMREGGLSAVHATIAYHETARETLSRIGEWNRRFEAWPELIRPVRQASDITLAQREGRVGVFFGFQNCSPIEDDIDLVEVFRQLGSSHDLQQPEPAGLGLLRKRGQRHFALRQAGDRRDESRRHADRHVAQRRAQHPAGH